MRQSELIRLLEEAFDEHFTEEKLRSILSPIIDDLLREDNRRRGVMTYDELNSRQAGKMEGKTFGQWLGDVKRMALGEYLKKRKEEIRAKQTARGRTQAEVSYTTINRELALMRTMFNVLIKAGKARSSPVKLISFFEEVQKERILTIEEEDLIIRTIEGSGKLYAHLKDMVRIALNTGMRQGEILGMKKSWIDLNEELIIVPRTAQKRKRRDKRVPINSEVRPIIKRLLKANTGSEYLFVNPTTGTGYTKVN